MKSSFEQPSASTIFLKSGRVAVGERARLEALARRGLLHLDAVLVGAGQEIDVATVEPLKRAIASVASVLIGVADMRRAVRVGNRGGDVEFRRLSSPSRLCCHACEKWTSAAFAWPAEAGTSHSGRAGECHEDGQDKLLPVEVEFVGLGRGTVDLLPYLRPSGKRNGRQAPRAIGTPPGSARRGPAGRASRAAGRGRSS